MCLDNCSSSAVVSNNTPHTNQQLLHGETFVYVTNDCHVTNDHIGLLMHVIDNVIVSQKNLMLPHLQIVQLSVL